MLESPKNRACWFSNAAIGVVPWIWIGPAEHRNQHSIYSDSGDQLQSLTSI